MSDPDFSRVQSLKLRQICSKCGKKRLYFCYDCLTYMDGVEEIGPGQVELPIQVHVIKHEAENSAKSTATHCALVARSSTRLLHAHDQQILPWSASSEVGQPDYTSDRRVAVVFPAKDAPTLADYLRAHPDLNTLVFLDATWNSVGQLRNLNALRRVPCVALNTYTTEYWRPQKGRNDECLATIEAIYHAIREVYHFRHPDQPYDGRFEPLLFWFRFFKQQFVDQSTGVKRKPNPK